MKDFVYVRVFEVLIEETEGRIEERKKEGGRTLLLKVAYWVAARN